ncbi:hypothetical protein Mapa_010752 [Marchantia paleacea]|nr:hypothetical protein Mapa_010752 [Marchantia paleacea]
MAAFAHSHFLNPSTSTTSSTCTCGSFVAGPFNNFQCRCSERRGVANMNTELKAKLKFLQSFEPGPMSDSFRGDLKLMGSDNIPVYAHRFIMPVWRTTIHLEGLGLRSAARHLLLPMSGKSPVFKKMFETEMEEKETGVVKIVDFTAPVLRAMVNFCYTAEIAFSITAPAEEVLKVAHKYDIPELKIVSEDELSRGFTTNNICLRLWLASMYGSKKLETEASKYVKDNFETIFPIIRKQIVPGSFGFSFQKGQSLWELSKSSIGS